MLRRKFHLLRRKNLNSTRIVAGSFAALILLGAVLLCLPAASQDGRSVGFFTSLFTATSATCVTGLSLVETASQWSLFGQAVLLCLIQLGGLGFISLITLFSLMVRRRIGLSERLIMVSTFNLSDLSGVVRLVRNALLWTLIFEGGGALLLATRFIPKFGLGKGVWLSVFHAVSAFCNAGFDLLGEDTPGPSVAAFSGDPVVLVTLMLLVVVGGLGFFVWMDWKEKRRFRALSLYSKLVLILTAGFLLLGAAVIFAVEYHNPATLGEMPLWKKILNALFESVTFRTAGFASFDQAGLRDSSMALGVLLMLIGGSSGSTAGGIKTVTAGLLILGLWSGLRGKNEVTLRGRSISQRQLNNAMTLALTVLLLFFSGTMFVSLLDGVPFLPAGFEVASALGTVGLSAGILPQMSLGSKSMLILFMYLGRVGILSFSIAFVMGRRKADSKIKYPATNIMIG